MEVGNRATKVKKYLLFLGMIPCLFLGGKQRTVAQDDDSSRIRVNVVLVQLNVAVTDRKGNYVSGLRPEDFAITEDGIPQKIATFGEGNEQVRELADATASKDESVAQY